MERTESNNTLIFKFLLASILVYSLMGVFAGLPEKANLTAFIVGFVILFMVLVVILGVRWIIFVKPLPDNQSPGKKLTAIKRG